MEAPRPPRDDPPLRGARPSRRARAHGAAALGLDAHDPLADAEAYELSAAADTSADDAPAAPTFVHAGFDKLTAGEHAWMLASLALVAALVAVGLYVCFAM